MIVKYMTTMRTLKNLCGAVLLGGIFAITLAAGAADKDPQAVKKPEVVKPYLLKTCAVSGDKLGGDMGDPYVFNYQGRQIKLCCKGCLTDFNKEPAKYIKKIELAEKKAKAANPSTPAKDHSAHQH